jgi:hypothetical protein
MARLRLRVLTAEEVARGEQTCGAKPSPGSSARCEQKPEHWLAEHSLSHVHAGRTQKGYWKHWHVTDEEMKRDAGAGTG